METVIAPGEANRIGAGTAKRCRTNSRRGLTDSARRSYPPVESVQRALEILRIVNCLQIASVNAIHAATGFPKPTIVRMLETLMADGYVARDNLCGGYRVTGRVRELTSGYDGISMVIEASRPLAIEFTRRHKWPIGIGVPDGEAIALQFWTGTISPLAHTNTVLGLRPSFTASAMGRAYLAFCPQPESEAYLQRLVADTARDFTPADANQLRTMLDQIRSDGYAVRDPRTEPRRMTTVAMPIRHQGEVIALISVSFYTTAVKKAEIAERVVAPLKETTAKIEESIGFVKADDVAGHHEAHPLPDF